MKKAKRKRDQEREEYKKIKQYHFCQNNKNLKEKAVQLVSENPTMHYATTEHVGWTFDLRSMRCIATL